MSAYLKNMMTRPLKVSDCIVDSGIPCEILNYRIFLNNHLTPPAGKLNPPNFMLRQDKTIIKYKIMNAAKPSAVMTLPDNTFVVRDLQGHIKLLKNQISPNTNV